MMRRSIVLSAALAALVPAAAAHAEVVDFQIESQSVKVDPSEGTAGFSITFNRTPIFITKDTSASDAFQYEVDADTSSVDPSLGWADVDAIIRGGEIWRGEGLPVRFPTGLGGPDADGWGPVRAYLPFELNEKTVTFTAPLRVLDAADDASFRYRAITIAGGGLTSEAVGAAVPLPAAVWSGIIMLGGLAAGTRIGRKLL